MLANPLYFFALALAAVVGVSAQTADACILTCVQAALANSTCSSLCVVTLDYLPSISLTPLTSAAPTSLVSAKVQASKKQRKAVSLQIAPLLTSRLPFNFNRKNAVVCTFPATLLHHFVPLTRLI
jgi:hypothetical protein